MLTLPVESAGSTPATPRLTRSTATFQFREHDGSRSGAHFRDGDKTGLRAGGTFVRALKWRKSLRLCSNVFTAKVENQHRRRLLRTVNLFSNPVIPYMDPPVFASLMPWIWRIRLHPYIRPRFGKAFFPGPDGISHHALRTSDSRLAGQPSG